jgi:flagellar protein FlgJ
MMDDNNSFFIQATALFNQQTQNEKLGSALKSAKNHAGDKTDPRLSAACTEMESLFVNYLLKEMRATVDRSGFISGGRAEEIFTSMLDVELSRNISAAGGIGLSSILLEQLAGRAAPKEGLEPKSMAEGKDDKILKLSDGLADNKPVE